MPPKVSEIEVDNRPTYFIVGPRNDKIRVMLSAHGWKRVTNQNEADILVFQGGADINPLLYGERRHAFTNISFHRDLEDIAALRLWKGPWRQGLVGICRGAQFLNCMVGGGTLWQHVTGHTQYHPMRVKRKDPEASQTVITTSSTHHQMMIPGPDAEVLAVAGKATEKHSATCVIRLLGRTEEELAREGGDTEVVFYPAQNTLCFQGHPEITGRANRECREYFLELLDQNFANTKAMQEAMAAHRKMISSMSKPTE